MNTDEKLVAILGGCDWYDASVDHLVVPKSINLEEEHKIWYKWYRNEYCGANPQPEFMTFTSWLIKLGARKTDEKDIEIFDET